MNYKINKRSDHKYIETLNCSCTLKYYPLLFFDKLNIKSIARKLTKRIIAF